jgi:hypothetical protein
MPRLDSFPDVTHDLAAIVRLLAMHQAAIAEEARFIRLSVEAEIFEKAYAVAFNRKAQISNGCSLPLGVFCTGMVFCP